MRFIILAYDPEYVREEDMEQLRKDIGDDFECIVYYIPHTNHEIESIYCVQFVDSERK